MTRKSSAKTVSDHTSSARAIIERITKQAAFDSTAPESHAEGLKALLEFAAFTEVPLSERPNPFDDPYVGAALLNERLEVIGAHRKESNQERHAEPNAVIAALDRASRDVPAALQLSNAIKKEYQAKSWLQGDKRVRDFENLFRSAGEAIRAHYFCEELYLYSTLEPCRDYETQPSCACIICATGISRVYYASDDTNQKGQGRAVLMAGRDHQGRTITVRPPKVWPNLAINEALSINRLFFTTVSLVDRLFSSEHVSPLSTPRSYSTFRLDQDYCEAAIDSDRLYLQQKVDVVLPIYRSAPSRFGAASAYSEGTGPAQQRQLAIERASVDPGLVLLLRDLTEHQLLDVLFDRAIHQLPLPAKILSTKSLPPLNADIQKVLDLKGVKWHPNSFRKHDEQFTAKQHVVFSELRSELRSALYILAKCTTTSPGGVEPYRSIFGTAAECVPALEDPTLRASRLTIYCRAENWHEVEILLGSLSSRGNFRETAPLGETSIDIRPCSLEGRRQYSGASQYLMEGIDRLRLSYRVKVHDELISGSLSAIEVSGLVSGATIDPSFFSPEFLRELTSSIDWRDRRSAGVMLAEVVSREPPMVATVVLSGIMEILDDDIGETSWTSLCTYLNSIQDLGLDVTKGDTTAMLAVLQRVHRVVAELIDRDRIQPWLVDVIWRWMACWAKYALADEAFSEPFLHQGFWTEIERSPFLLSQLAYYATVTRSPVRGVERFAKILRLKAPGIPPVAAKATAVMCARLAFAYMLIGASGPGEKLRDAVQILGDPHAEIYAEELDRCGRVWRNRLGSVETAKDDWERGRAFATLANLRALVPAVRRVYSDAAITRDTLGHIQTWRGDQIGAVDQALLELSPAALVCAVRGLVTDTDVSTRWAGLAYALEPGQSDFRNAVMDGGGKANLHQLREFRRTFARAALDVESHYWLEREIISRFTIDSAPQNSAENPLERALHSGLPALSDLGLDEIFLGSAERSVHPEVQLAIKRYSTKGRKIALILPPVYGPHERPKAESSNLLNGGSPPLGLGQIAAVLSSAGHFVKIFDAHRYIFPHNELITALGEFDYVGISVVISTIESARIIAADLKNLPDPPLIVIGGHAPTLMTISQLDRAGFGFDYVVSGPGEESFLQIIEAEMADGEEASERPHDAISTVKTLLEGRETASGTAQLEKVRRASRGAQSRDYQQKWSTLPWIDRRLFRAPGNQAPYEPSVTRDGNHREAHLVVSRGCDWGCTFCTEALIGGDFGETRREVNDVQAEIEYLISNEKVNRIQFVDDNILPSRINKPGQLGVKTKLDWAEEFLDSLRNLQTKAAPFNWRGLMRLEDFLLYEDKLPGFVSRLSASGCNLLAFGIESGVERHRSRLKGMPDGPVTNSTIEAVVKRLKDNKIFTKGYFILGGPGQSAQDSQETIRFAAHADFDLAYFAIYKDFRGLVRASGANNLLSFGLFTSGISDALSNPNDVDLWWRTFGDDPSEGQRLEFAREFESLSARGFSFRDIIKYNDYHTADEFYAGLGYKDGADAYLKSLSNAYVQFYCRPGWSHRYGDLIAAGY